MHPEVELNRLRTVKISPLAAFVALALSAAAELRADITREQAIDIVNDIVSPATLDHEARAFLTLAPLEIGDRIEPFDEPDRGTTLTARSWFAWIDDDPEAFFAHKVRFVFIDASTGAVRVEAQRWWPEVNGEPPFSRDAVAANPLLRIFSTRLVPTTNP